LQQQIILTHLSHFNRHILLHFSGEHPHSAHVIALDIICNHFADKKSFDLRFFNQCSDKSIYIIPKSYFETIPKSYFERNLPLNNKPITEVPMNVADKYNHKSPTEPDNIAGAKDLAGFIEAPEISAKK
jgi:hypothetical protein